MTKPFWRPLLASDIATVSRIAAQVHPGFPEADAVFAERQALSPQGCWLLETGQAGIGYVLSHPWRLGTVPALNARLGAIPEAPDTFYIHDLALLPAARGSGAASAIVETLIEVARPYRSMSLVAVNDSVAFWSRFGFAVEARPELAEKLMSYDAAARFMVRQAG